MNRLKTLIITLLCSIAAMGQSSDSIAVSLITCYPGSDVYELYGHTEIRVREGWDDRLFNYGIFDFNAPHFVYRFVKGVADYKVAAYSFEYVLRGYEGRKIVEQVLNLTQEQARTLRDCLNGNVRPENASYHYNYIYDNCATRPRDIVEKACGKINYPQMTDTTTFRKEMAHYNKNYPWQQFGIDLALGVGLDKPLTYREEMFVPMVLMQAFAGATIDRDGEKVPLVKETFVLNQGSDEGAIAAATVWWKTPLAVAVLFFVITLLMCVRDYRKKAVTKWFDTIMYGIYGLAGCLIFFLIFVSMQEATSPNVNGFWLNPFCLIAAVLIWIPKAKRVLYWYHFANYIIVATTMIPFLREGPWMANWAFLPLMASVTIRSLCYTLINKSCATKNKKISKTIG